MRKIIIVLAIVLILIPTLALGASIPLRATWTPNTDTVTIGYKLYRTDGTRTLIGAITGRNPTFPYLFNITVPDGSYGTATFVVTAYSVTKESADSNTASYTFDLTLDPAAPAGLIIIR